MLFMRDNNDWLCTYIFPFNHCDEDAEFIHTLAECWGNELDIVKFTDKYKNQLSRHSDADLPHLLDFDPDINYQNLNNNCINSCDYHHEDSMN